MSKKTRKEKRLSSSSSSEEDEKASRWEEFTNKHKDVKRKEFSSSHLSHAKKQKECGPQGIRQIKKATYRQANSNRESDEKKVVCGMKRHIFRPCQRSSFYTQENIYTSRKGIDTYAGDHVLGAQVKPLRGCSPDLQRGEKTPQCDLHNESSQKTSSRLIKCSTSSSSSAAKMQEHRKTSVKMSSRSKLSSKNDTNSKNASIREKRECPLLAKSSRLSSSKTKKQSCAPTKCIVSNRNAPKQRNIPSVSCIKAKSTCSQPSTSPNTPAPHPNSRIQKKAQPLLVYREFWMDKKDNISTNTRNYTSGSQPSGFKTSLSNDKLTEVVEELHQARSGNALKLKVSEKYGELTCMEIDVPEEQVYSGKTYQQDLIIVLDTNILLSHLGFIKTITCHGLGAWGFPMILIPWVVLQELDSLKNKRRLKGSVTHLAFPAVDYIYKCLKSPDSHLLGQSMQQATQISHELNAENNDDRVLQCCLQYQHLYQKSTLILCTNDKNLCSKACLSGVKAVTQADLLEKFGRNNTDLLRPFGIELSAPKSNQSCTQPQTHGNQSINFYQSDLVKDSNKMIGGMVKEERSRALARGVALMENCLRGVLSEILTVEMKVIYDDLWEEIVYLKPPWTLPDVLQCFKKHWIAVFGNIVPRNRLKAVTTLIDFFTSDTRVEYSTMLRALSTAKELLQFFGRSNYGSSVQTAISSLRKITHSLQSQPENTEKCYTDYGEAMLVQEVKEATHSQASHDEVWALLDDIWKQVFHMSLAVFKALKFDPGMMQCTQPECIPLPQDALAYLYKLSPTVTQLLQALTSLQSPDAGVRETQALLRLIHSIKIFEIKTKLKDEDLLNCFSQQEYREKLRVGSGQLIELKAGLDRCLEEMSRHYASSKWLGPDPNQAV